LPCNGSALWLCELDLRATSKELNCFSNVLRLLTHAPANYFPSRDQKLSGHFLECPEEWKCQMTDAIPVCTTAQFNRITVCAVADSGVSYGPLDSLPDSRDGQSENGTWHPTGKEFCMGKICIGQFILHIMLVYNTCRSVNSV